jgi:hypothetical protein
MLARSLAFSALALVVGCGGPSGTGPGGTTPVATRRPYTPCDNPAEVRMAPHVCWNPAGSHWHVTSSAPGGELEFDVELMAGGRVRATDHDASSPATDEWFVDDGTLRVFLGNRWVEYRGDLTNGTLLVGVAVNARGDQWDWRGERVHGGSCPAGELVAIAGDEPACYSAAGSRWTIRGRSGSTFIVELGPNGTLYSDDPSDTTTDNDTWEQNGESLSLSFDGGASEYSATLRPASLTRFEGNARDASGTWSFTAEAVPTYPPPIH